MPMFIQPFDVTEDNRHLHLYNIETANSLAYQFNQNIMEEPSSFVYNPNTKRIQLHTEFDLHPENSKVIAQQINWILDFEDKFNDKDDYLTLYLNKFKTETLNNTELDIIKHIFTNLNLEDYFGKVSATFLKDKINELLIV
jgi:hypothetical protein